MLSTIRIVSALIFMMSAAVPVSAANVSFTVLHTNDFHGQLESFSSNPGAARIAQKIADVRAAVGAGNLLVLDAGDLMQGSLLSNIEKGVPTIDYYRTIGYNAATFGNHDFDWGQAVLGTRIAEAEAPSSGGKSPVRMIAANITKKDSGGSCTWEPFHASVTPYEVFTVGTAPNTVRVGVIGVGSVETPYILPAAATAGLCFLDPFETITRYYSALEAASDVLVVLSHNGYVDGGYGYGLTVYGDQTLAQKLNTAGTPVHLIIGGHSHTNLTAATMVGSTAVVQAYYNGRRVGRADVTYDTSTGSVNVTWTPIIVTTTDPQYAPITALVSSYVGDPTYQALINQPVGYSAVDLPRLGGTVDNMMATFIDDAVYKQLNSDSEPVNDVDIFFNNAGGIRTDWCYNGTAWVTTGCVSGTHAAALLTYANMFTILPFGNSVVVGDMTGAQILHVLNQAPLVSNGVIQPAGLRYKYYKYRDTLPPGSVASPYTYAWGAFDYCVVNRTTKACEPLDLDKTYRVGTNEFLAPAGGDGYGGFKYMTNVTYWGDMLDLVDAYVSAHHGTPATAYKGPNGDGTLDGRILREGDDSSGSIIPVTILHHNDSHGNLAKGTYVGYTQLASLIKQEKAHNPTRTLLLSAGDQIQGDAMMYYFRTERHHPMMEVMNSMSYDAMTLGNHEFNFGGGVFQSVLGQAGFPILGANVSDDGRYGLAAVQGGQGVKPYIERNLGGVKVAVLGVTNHRVPNYELPSNIVGLTFDNPVTAAQQYGPQLKTNNDAVIALTHIGFTTNPKSVEVDSNVDTNLAAQVSGIDAIIGGHSHTNPASPESPYKFLPAIVVGPSNTPVIINQAYRYNNTLGEVILGMRAKGGGGYDVVSRVGSYLSVTSGTPEDAATKAIVDPYVTALNAYNTTVVGQTTVPIDALTAFTQETNGANLQADASVYELASKGIAVDFHLAGAMTNKKIADGATQAAPVTLKVSDMFSLMPYENSLAVLSMNGPQLKRVLERAYRNYYYYKYVPGYGGYSYYTTCMLDINAGGRITYADLYPAFPDGDNVVSLVFVSKGKEVEVDFKDASTYYRVSTVNYLAAGSCNFNDSGVSLWPLEQITNDTQYYVRDAVTDYIAHLGTVSPAIEGRLSFVSSELQVTGGGTGSGRVTDRSGKIDCAYTSPFTRGNCSAQFSPASSATLTAQPAAGSAFTGWGGDCAARGTSVTVTMDKPKACSASFTSCPAYTLLSDADIFGAGGGSGSVPVSTGTGCYWTAVSNAGWITLSPPSSGSGSGTLGYAVEANTSASPRVGTLTVAGNTFTVTQLGMGCTYAIEPLSHVFGSSGGAGIVNVASPEGCGWSSMTGDSWITIGSHDGTGNGTVSFSVAPYAGVTARSGSIWVEGHNVGVTQSASCARLPVWLRHVSASYSSIPVAYEMAQAGEVIEVQAVTFWGDLVFDLNKTVSLEGGYDCDYSGNSSRTTVLGTLTVRAGTVVVENLIVK